MPPPRCASAANPPAQRSFRTFTPASIPTAAARPARTTPAAAAAAAATAAVAVAASAAAARAAQRPTAAAASVLARSRLFSTTMAAAASPSSAAPEQPPLVLGVVAADDPAATAEFGRRFRAVEGHPPVRLGEVDASRFDAALYFRTLKAARQAALRTEELAAMALPAEQATNASLPLPSDLRAGSLLLHAHQCASTQEFMRAHSAGPLAIAAQAAAQTHNGWNEPKPLLPDGAALIADEQGDGRGRGGNRWASPGGCLMFTCLRSLRVPGQLAPFINYAVCLAVVEGAREAAAEAAAEALRRAAQAAVNGGGGADDQEAITRAARAAADSLPLRVKWPNDIYCSWDGPLGGGGGAGSSSSAAPDPSPSPSLQAIPDPRDPTGLPPVVKIGGALIHTTFSGGGKFSVLTGVGLNVSNRAPTTCLDALLERALPSAGQQGGLEAAAARGGVAVRREVLLAHVLARLDACFASLEARGFAPLERRYLAAWLHSGQRLALAGPEQGGPAPGSPAAMAAAAGEGGGGKAGGAVITVAGLSPSGFLLGVDDAGGQYELTPDGNSLDMMAGLLRRRL